LKANNLQRWYVIKSINIHIEKEGF